MRTAALVFAFSFVCCACDKRSPSRSAIESAAAPALAPPNAAPMLAPIEAAERRRESEAVTDEALSSRDLRVRIAATRALARIGDAHARERLLAALADESLEVVRWAAFGVGRTCAGREQEFSAAIALRAASLFGVDAVPSRELAHALADALAHCGGATAQRTLRSWLTLERPIAEAAALALGRLAGRQGTLDEATWVALLDAATRAEPVPDALYAFARTPVPEGALRERLLRIARADGPRPANDSGHLIRALGRLGPEGAAPLGEWLANTHVTHGERAEAARELARLGAPGQAVLAKTLSALVPDGESAVEAAASLQAIQAVLAGLSTRPRSILPALEKLAELPVPREERSARMVVAVRCAAASLLADRSSLNARLLACDPDPAGRTGKLAVLAVLGRGQLVGPRAVRFTELARDTDPLVRQAAIRALAAHREYATPHLLVAEALRDAAPGVAAAAAELLAQHPERAEEPSSRARTAGALRPHEPVIAALSEALRAAEKSRNIPLHGMLIDATAALGLLSLNADIERACGSDNPTLRERAERARRILSRSTDPCVPAKRADQPPPVALPPSTRLLLETDAGELEIELDTVDAPVAAARLVELARSGFYDNTPVERVVPGFVVQLGDPGGDGYGNASLPPLRCELSPSLFEAGAVGIALSGRDTGNSQFFVTLGRHPHLDGEYTRVGRAGKGWEHLWPGDRVTRVRVRTERD